MEEAYGYFHPGMVLNGLGSPAETFKRAVRKGWEYDHLFPRADMKETTVKKSANVSDTVEFIPRVVAQTRWMTQKLSRYLERPTLRETCRAIWEWCYQHITYHKDEQGKEQIRSPARVWADRFRGVDCDCYTTFISTILTNLEIPHTYRITRYKASTWEHIYPIVPVEGGYHITIDCVAPRFDYEVGFKENKDFKMELSFLSGLGGSSAAGLGNSPYSDRHLFLDDEDGMNELGRIFKKKLAKKAAKADASQPGAAAPKKRKGKGFFIVNRINPAAALLRNGFLASMKLNVKRVAERLRWTYLSETEAARRGIDIGKYRQYLNTRQKLENLFYKAGGKPDNLRKAILTGKGNKDKAINGLGYVTEYLDASMPLPQVLGIEMYADENAGVMYGYRDQRVDYILDGLGLGSLHGSGALGELGEPATATGLAAVAAVIAGIATTLDKIGALFPGKKTDSGNNAAGNEENTGKPLPALNPALIDAGGSNSNVNTSDGKEFKKPAGSNSNNLPAPEEGYVPAEKEPQSEGGKQSGGVVKKEELPGSENNPPPRAGDDKPGWWATNKKWALPTAIGTGVLLTGLLLYRATSKASQSGGQGRSSSGAGLNGLPSKRKNHQRKRKRSKSAGKRVASIRLM
jgi:hypothetical protein